MTSEEVNVLLEALAHPSGRSSTNRNTVTDEEFLNLYSECLEWKDEFPDHAEADEELLSGSARLVQGTGKLRSLFYGNQVEAKIWKAIPDEHGIAHTATDGGWRFPPPAAWMRNKSPSR